MPLWTHCDASASIVLIVLSLFAITPVEHRIPGGEGRALDPASRVAVLDVEIFNGIRAFPAHALPSGHQCTAVNDVLLPALTDAKAFTNPVNRYKVGNHFSLSKSPSGEQLSCRHSIGNFNVVFSGGLPATTGAHCD